MIIKNVKVYTPERCFKKGEIRIENGIITAVSVETADRPAAALTEMGCGEVMEGEGCYAIPGLIDMHFHGCMGHDFCDGTEEAIQKIAEYEASIGVTAIAPATMTLPVEELERILAVAAAYKKTADCDTGADIVGINMEGPFISKVKKGAQDAQYIIPCDAGVCQRFLDASEGLVKFVGIAPEDNPGAEAFIQTMKDKVNISLAHTNADYDSAMAAFNAGADHAVHLYNAMPPYTHRAPGVIGAVSDSPHVDAEIICDGIHIHPSVVRATFNMLGAERMVLISDSMRATGMPDGIYTLGGLDVQVVGNRATLVSDGALAGSATNLLDCLRTAVQQMNISLEAAVAAATINPARSLGIEDSYGSIESGRKGNIVLLGEDLSLKAVVKDGKLRTAADSE